MASLGSFGTKKPLAEPDDFEYFGTTVRTNPNMSDLALVDFLELAESIDVNDTAQAMAALAQVKGFLRVAVHPDDFDAFWATARVNGQDVEDLLPVMWAAIEARADRPTGLPADSTAGQQTTPPTSSSDSPGQELRAREFLARRYPERPDLQLAGLVAARGRIASGEPSQRSA
jgi:hypothetical protein